MSEATSLSYATPVLAALRAGWHFSERGVERVYKVTSYTQLLQGKGILENALFQNMRREYRVYGITLRDPFRAHPDEVTPSKWYPKITRRHLPAGVKYFFPVAQLGLELALSFQENVERYSRGEIEREGVYTETAADFAASASALAFSSWVTRRASTLSFLAVANGIISFLPEGMKPLIYSRGFISRIPAIGALAGGLFAAGVATSFAHDYFRSTGAHAFVNRIISRTFFSFLS